MDKWKSRGGKSQRGEAQKWEDQRRERERERDAGARKGGKVVMRSFPLVGGSGGSKSRLAKAAGAEPCCRPLWREAHFQVKMYKIQHSQTTFGIEMSKKCMPLWREARFQVKSVKNCGFGPLLDVDMLQKCAPLWREAHFQVKSVINCGVRTAFGSWDVEKVDALVARSTFPSQLTYTLTNLTNLTNLPN